MVLVPAQQRRGYGGECKYKILVEIEIPAKLLVSSNTTNIGMLSLHST
jgi:hypothetical protein